MSVISRNSKYLVLLAAMAVPVSGLSAQELESADGQFMRTVYGERLPSLSEMAEGPEVEGIISARKGDVLQVTTVAGTNQMVNLSEETSIKASGGFLGLDRDTLGRDSLLNGLPVTVKTMEYQGALVASQIKLKSKDLKTANMIRNGTSQQFAEHDVAINQNAAATEALRGRMGDIDQYNVKGTTNVYFDTGKANLSSQARNELCQAASQAESMDNALLLVVGYTDSTGSYELNQALSEKRAGRVVNFLQQQCGWKPYRMLTPTGMAEADPVASNDTMSGKAQNRRVAVNILVSKAVDEL